MLRVCEAIAAEMVDEARMLVVEQANLVSARMMARALGTSRSTARRVLLTSLQARPLKRGPAPRLSAQHMATRHALAQRTLARLKINGDRIMGIKTRELTLSSVVFTDEKIFRLNETIVKHSLGVPEATGSTRAGGWWLL